ncbi:MAG: hypothetical protein LUE86_11280 [Clostridiales bacterium]|nr:hypothetical protein [Clostridiales bacterium]
MPRGAGRGGPMGGGPMGGPMGGGPMGRGPMGRGPMGGPMMPPPPRRPYRGGCMGCLFPFLLGAGGMMALLVLAVSALF